MKPPSSCSSSGCCSTLNRREALKRMGVAAAAALAPSVPAMAGPFDAADFEKLVPKDKKLDANWVKSLFARGSKTVYRGEELRFIGMPIGGLFSGQVYLGGDGRLWHWDIFNQHVSTGAEHYANPMKPGSPLDQGFAIVVTSANGHQSRRLDRSGWSDITFNGEYPIGIVEYRDPALPISVSLEAFSPFAPLSVDDSSHPATVLRFSVKNTSSEPAEVELGGWLENAVCFHSSQNRDVLRRNRVTRREGMLVLDCSAELPPAASVGSVREDIVFDDFERETYGDWTATGTAFGNGPVAKSAVPDYQGDLAMHGSHAVNSHAAAPGGNVGARDGQIGILLSKSFQIERNYITFLIGGGSHRGSTCANLLVDDKVVLTATGASDNRMKLHAWDARKWSGKTARIQLVDNEKGAWGNIGIDHIVFTDHARVTGPLAEETDFGTMTLALLEAGSNDSGSPALFGSDVPGGLFSKASATGTGTVSRSAEQKLIGGLTRKLSLKPDETRDVVFVVSWHFPNLRLDRLPAGRHYGKCFSSSIAVAEHIAARYNELRELTRLWHDTWYESSLPYWLLDRTFLNTSILATSTSFRLGDGRFWGWEGVGCCHGTCGHVWQYAHAMARLFPSMESETRERVDFGLALKADGAIHFRAEHNNIPAIDSQAGTILRALREHQMRADSGWLMKNWPGIKRATEWLIGKDANGDGIIEGNQHNTLDTDWFGPVAWLSGMYLASLRAAEEMAMEAGDEPFAIRCREIFEQGRHKLVADLYNGEYFINKVDPKHLDAINSGSGCEIDQVLGQSWAFQTGLGRIFPEKETRSALRSLWRYNFAPDVGAYRAAHKPGRWYAMPGEAGLLMCTFPKEDWDYDKAKGKGADWAAGYFNECMNGFEYQVAGHMIAEGMILEGLAVTRAVHDRYHASRRNPWNEVECGDHYARSMASYGIFLTACGFEYNGPNGHIGFAPKIGPENFMAAFTSAEGWGSYSQRTEHNRLFAGIDLKWGRLSARSLAFEAPANDQYGSVAVLVNGRVAPAKLSMQGRRAFIELESEASISANQTIQVTLS